MLESSRCFSCKEASRDDAGFFEVGINPDLLACRQRRFRCRGAPRADFANAGLAEVSSNAKQVSGADELPVECPE